MGKSGIFVRADEDDSDGVDLRAHTRVPQDALQDETKGLQDDVRTDENG